GAMAFSMVLLFGCFAFAAGIATVIAAARSGRAGDSWGALLLEGLAGIAVGAVALLWPASTALAFVWMIGVWAIASGALEIASASASDDGQTRISSAGRIGVGGRWSSIQAWMSAITSCLPISASRSW